MGIQLFQYHPVIGYTFIPNLKVRVDHEAGGYLVQTNAAGFRSEHQFCRDKIAGRYRVFLFGDSFTAGDAVSNKKRFGDILESVIPGIKVYNFGLPGTGTDQHYLVWKEIAREYACDLVVIAIQVENIRRIVTHHRLTKNEAGKDVLFAKPYFESLQNELVLRGVPVPKEPILPADLDSKHQAMIDHGGKMPWLRSIVNKLGAPVKDVAQKISGYQPLPEYDNADGTEWKLMKSILRKWTDELTVPAIIMPIPLYHYIEEAAAPVYRTRFSELNSLPNVTVHDPFDDYMAVPKLERRAFRFSNDIHPTPQHHKLLADSLARAVRPYVAAREGVAV